MLLNYYAKFHHFLLAIFANFTEWGHHIDLTPKSSETQKSPVRVGFKTLPTAKESTGR